MTRAALRGNALPETALVISLMLMLTLAAIDLATVGFNQAEADGAAFVGARTLAVNNTNVGTPTGVATASAQADTAIQGVFHKVPTATIVVEPAPGSYIGAEVTLPGQGIHLLNGISSPSQQVGHTFETTLGTANPLGTNLAVVSDAPCAVILLNNSLPGVYQSIRLAQDATPTNPNANGTNLNFGEFSIHQSVYAGLTSIFPSGASVVTLYTNYAADLANVNGVENTMTKWDTVGYSSGSSTWPAANQTTCQPAPHA